MLTHQRLTELLDYDPETGYFRWKTSRIGQRSKGSIAGGRKKDAESNTAYLQITVDKVRYYAHRLAWFYVYKLLPDAALDHINHDGLDNRIVNLRLASASQNAINPWRVKPNKSGLTGVRKRTRSCFEARINIDGRHKILGYFKTAEAAKDAYQREFNRLYGDFLGG